MSLRLKARPLHDAVDFTDPVAASGWIRARLAGEALRGQIHPRIYLLGDGFVETLDLDPFPEQAPGADAGATFQMLRRRAGVQAAFLCVRLTFTAEDDETQPALAVIELRVVAEGPRWWVALLPFHLDPATGLGRVGEWEEPFGEITDPWATLPESLAALAAPRAGAVAAEVGDAARDWQPDIKMAFGELPPQADPPPDARAMIELARVLGVFDELLSNRVQGVVVVRIAGRSWEQWVLSGDMPGPTLEMVRWITHRWQPPADGVAVVQLALREQDQPPRPGIFATGEKDGLGVRLWAPMELPEGPTGPRSAPVGQWTEPHAVPPRVRCLGVEPTVTLDLPEPN